MDHLTFRPYFLGVGEWMNKRPCTGYEEEGGEGFTFLFLPLKKKN